VQDVIKVKIRNAGLAQKSMRKKTTQMG
jgi:hypothetical protein